MDQRIKATPVVAIVGRPNVGKSTLFNRLLEQRKAIVSPIPGTTRDMNFGHCHWRGEPITVIDTAGLDLTSEGATDEAMKRQADAAMHKADIILFLADAQIGPVLEDKVLGKYLQKSKKPVILIANKADNPKTRKQTEEPDWLKFGMGEPLPISAANGTGVGDMLDLLYDRIAAMGLGAKPMPEIDARIAIIGRPNVGKSTLLNRLAGEERVIVSEVPHTTKEPQDTLVTWVDEGGTERNVLLVDTVGIRKRAHVEPGLEGIGVTMSIGEIARADVVILVIDAVEGLNLQEKRLLGLALEKHPGVLIAVNKWDLAQEKKLGTAGDYKDYLATELRFAPWIPVVFMSAKTGDRVGKILGHAIHVAREREKEIPQEQIELFMEKLKKVHHSAFRKGENRPKVYGMTQIGTKPPKFMLVVYDKDTVHPNYLRFIENRLREEFQFDGTPVRVLSREIE